MVCLPMPDTICDEKDIVMVVDDDEMMEEMMERMVHKYGCAHVSFDGPLTALRYFKENAQRVTILITDLTMPSISGAGLIKEVLQINPKLPIILVTGHDGEHVPDDIMSLVRHIVPKPFTTSELIDIWRIELVRTGHEHRN
jgi:FixJ family two-component response regulator